MGRARCDPCRGRLPDPALGLLRQHSRDAPEELMTPEPTPGKTTDFDSYAGDYDSALARGISVSGENKIYFARERIAWLANCLEKLHMHPCSVLDFGCGTGSSTRFFLDLLGAQSVIGADRSDRSLQV